MMYPKKKNITSHVVWILVLFITVVSCVHEPLITPGQGPVEPNPTDTTSEQEPCDPSVIYFENEILPMLVSNCAKSGCHNAASAEEDIVLDSYDNVMNSDVIEPGDPGDSELYEKITETDPDDVMPPPPHQRLTTEQISKIRTWIRQGADNTVCTVETCETTNVTFSGSIFPMIKTKCQGCHSGAAPSGNINLTTHQGVQTIALNGRMIGAVTHASGFTPMPMGGKKLSQCEIDQIKIWVDAGAPNN